jgi:antitoxin HicB
VPALPGCVTQGDTREEALANIREAIAGYLESLREHQEPIPPSIHEEIVEVQVTELPVVSGREAVQAFGRVGYQTDRQRGSHNRYKTGGVAPPAPDHPGPPDAHSPRFAGFDSRRLH